MIAEPTYFLDEGIEVDDQKVGAIVARLTPSGREAFLAELSAAQENGTDPGSVVDGWYLSMRLATQLPRQRRTELLAQARARLRTSVRPTGPSNHEAAEQEVERAFNQTRST